MALRVYDPKDVTITFGNAGVLSGYADGTFVSIDFNEEFYTLQIGSDGEGTRSKTNNLSARVTVSLMQDSPSNDALSTILLTDLASNLVLHSMQIKDLNGTSLFNAEKMYIVKPPTSEFAREATGREWVFETDSMTFNVGSNNLA